MASKRRWLDLYLLPTKQTKRRGRQARRLRQDRARTRLDPTYYSPTELADAVASLTNIAVEYTRDYDLFPGKN